MGMPPARSGQTDRRTRPYPIRPATNAAGGPIGLWARSRPDDPDDLAAVANGAMASYEPQPYATKSIDDRLYNVQTDQQWHHVGAATYDPAWRLLYVLEPLVDEEKPIVHVWSID